MRIIYDPGPQNLGIGGGTATLTLMQLVEHAVDNDQRFTAQGVGELAAARIRAAFHAGRKSGVIELENGDHDMLCAALLTPTAPLRFRAPDGETIAVPRLKAQLIEAVLSGGRLSASSEDPKENGTEAIPDEPG